jgi:quinol monooxygenase YgiN
VSELQGIARFEFHEGELEEFKRLAARCMEIVRTKDTGTLRYDVYFNDDRSISRCSRGVTERNEMTKPARRNRAIR